ncbi:response regulator transcription factor [Algoriphagus halophytocola]|uniref:Response regulator transcription factor n=1 Tax=Algoriphagus halophytocola TaxID=2991499 RepID=A0ABY6MCJ5_9BACT|nr:MULTISPECIES: response regulator transcription factor [unclassified Algoriphagus]UZD21417.1 response regulator transcription factor [Algoriphagus sp. TR-M5]WBL42630.1 response regulator transcription factor [Algoriphagus sp. TR-M9]
MNEVKTILVDDHPIVMEGIEMLLHEISEIQLIGKFTNGKSAQEFLSATAVDLIITDISMPELDGLQLTKWVKENHPETKVIILSMHDNDHYVQEIILADAEGYLLKENTSEELVNAVNRVLDDGIYYSDQIVGKLRSNFQLQNKKHEILQSLSERELDVLQLIIQELTTQEIADKLFISRHTVESHKKNLFKKTHQNSLVGLVKFSISNQLINL